jgi:hypothetical protein
LELGRHSWQLPTSLASCSQGTSKSAAFTLEMYDSNNKLFDATVELLAQEIMGRLITSQSVVLVEWLSPVRFPPPPFLYTVGTVSDWRRLFLSVSG